MKNKKKNIVTSIVIGILVTLCVFCGCKCYTATTKLKNAENEVITTQNELNISQKNLQSEIEKNDELSKELDNTKKKT
jgi:amino acid permease